MSSNLAAALVAFRRDCPNIGFDAVNPHFKSKYASLAAIQRVVDPLLAKHGLAVVQFPVGDDSTAGCITRILHESGESMEQEFRVPIGKADAQKACAAVSYARRFGLSGALGLVTTDDVDGNDAVGDPAPERPRSSMSQESKEDIRDAAKKRAAELDTEGVVVTYNEIIIAVSEGLGLESPAGLTDSHFGAVMSAVEKFHP